jgi:hypothetical protein
MRSLLTPGCSTSGKEKPDASRLGGVCYDQVE